MRNVGYSAGKLKLISKSVNVGSKVLRDEGFGFLIIVLTVSGPIIRPSSVRQSLFWKADSFTAVIEISL